MSDGEQVLGPELARRVAVCRATVKNGFATSLPEAASIHLARKRFVNTCANCYPTEDQKRCWRKQRRSRETVARLRSKVLSTPICLYCGAMATVVDHIVPLSGGGGNQPWNLAPACRICNDLKSNYVVRGISSRKMLRMLRKGDSSVILAVFGIPQESHDDHAHNDDYSSYRGATP